jgi:tubulin---tyrosine ligase
MIDSLGKVWLIEVNTNPSIIESGVFLKALIPRMINDAFKLTIDLVFPLPKQANQNNQE